MNYAMKSSVNYSLEEENVWDPEWTLGENLHDIYNQGGNK